MPSLRSRLSGPGGKLFKARVVGLTIVLWCVPPPGDEIPLIVSTVLAMEDTVLAMEEKQARFLKARALVKAERAEKAKQQAAERAEKAKKQGCGVN